jgi:membrane-associated protease RseP (regulator of RpoE activity)
VFLLEPNETPYDLRFSLFRIPVRVHPMFWLFSAILGWDLLRDGLQYLAAWIVLVFVSILVHELGHVWMGMAFGSHGRIVMYSFGGLAVGSNRLANRGQRVLVMFAGPLAGFVFAALALAAQELRVRGLGRLYLAEIGFMLGVPHQALQGLIPQEAAPFMALTGFEQFLMREFCFVNIAWGLLNLLPVFPLDGGQISREVFEGFSPRHGTVWALSLSVGVAAVFAVHSLMVEYGRRLIPFLPIGGMWAALMFGLLAYQSFQMLQQIQAQRRWHDDRWN